MQSTASGKDSVLFGGDFSCAGGLSAGRSLCGRSSFYIYLIFRGNHPPGGLPKTGGHGILQYIIVEK